MLADSATGDALATQRLVPAVYDQLRGLARAYLRRQPAARDPIFQTTALVHDACVRLLGRDNLVWESHAHFFAVAARSMRQVLASEARRLRALRRGGGRIRVSLDAADPAAPSQPGGDFDPVALDAALDELARLDERQSQVVEMRFFAGMREEEIAHVLRISLATVEREWRSARAWLISRLQRGELP